MSSDLDQRLAVMLDAHAGADVDPAPIVAQAVLRGRHLRRRRRGLVTSCVAAACAVVAAAFMVVPLGQTARQTALLLPASPNQPGAAERPDLVGTDPAVVHFTADNLVSGARYATWTTGRGVERVEFQGGTGPARFVLAGSAATLDGVRQTLSSSGRPRPPADVRVGERPGTAWMDPAPSGGPGLWFVRWQPVDGLWARLEIHADDRDEAVGAAGRVRFDGARRCAVPFRLQSLPAGARLLECSVQLSLDRSDPFSEGSLVVGDSSGRWLTVRAQRPAVSVGTEAGDLMAGPYRVRRQGSDVLEMWVKPCQVELFLDGWGHGYTEPDGLSVLGGYRPAAAIADPGTW
ncbi:hypothetical protein ABZ783_03230 [Micromonospora sp. NPDC047738]|uniref:hypothetical protein n=1 Tax=Micromonospora sp. NPDC047738 TaxID=3155741 RepID=UPI0033E3034D